MHGNGLRKLSGSGALVCGTRRGGPSAAQEAGKGSRLSDRCGKIMLRCEQEGFGGVDSWAAAGDRCLLGAAKVLGRLRKPILAHSPLVCAPAARDFSYTYCLAIGRAAGLQRAERLPQAISHPPRLSSEHTSHACPLAYAAAPSDQSGSRAAAREHPGSQGRVDRCPGPPAPRWEC
jgi:hypothetical protein